MLRTQQALVEPVRAVVVIIKRQTAPCRFPICRQILRRFLIRSIPAMSYSWLAQTSESRPPRSQACLLWFLQRVVFPQGKSLHSSVVYSLQDRLIRTLLFALQGIYLQSAPHLSSCVHSPGRCFRLPYEYMSYRQMTHVHTVVTNK